MAKRFTQTDIWDEDWFLEMPKEYKLFWFYLKDQCNHAGIWRPNKRLFEAIIEGKVDLNKALDYFNYGKDRITVLASGHWFINDFFVFQYGCILNTENRVHESIQKIYNQEDIILTSIRGLKEVKLTTPKGLKTKDKDKDISSSSSLKKVSSFIRPTIEDIRLYCEERKNDVDPERFFNHYQSKGWLIGKSKMKDWQAAVRTWEQSNKKKINDYDPAELFK